MRWLLTIGCVALAHVVAAQRVDSVVLGDTTVAIPITAARILASVDGATATERPVHARKDQVVMLYVAVEALAVTGTPTRRSGRTRARSRRHRTQRYAGPSSSEPAADYSNEVAPPVSTSSRSITATAIDAREPPSITADVRPDADARPRRWRRHDALPARRHAGRRARSRARVPRRGAARGSGGLTDAVMRVSIRRDDTLPRLSHRDVRPAVHLGLGRAHRRRPTRASASKAPTARTSWSTARAAWASSIPYTWTGGLPTVTKLLAAGTRGDDGVYRDAPASRCRSRRSATSCCSRATSACSPRTAARSACSTIRT